MPTALQLAEGNRMLEDAVHRSRKLLNRRALVGAAASAVPIPGLDWAVDAALLSRLLPAINAQFGLTPQQLFTWRREARKPPEEFTGGTEREP